MHVFSCLPARALQWQAGPWSVAHHFHYSLWLKAMAVQELTDEELRCFVVIVGLEGLYVKLSGVSFLFYDFSYDWRM
jgi:hypothetical protein